MSGITNPAEEYFKNGLWAWDPAAGVWLKLIIDPLTNQLSVAVNNDAEVHQTAPADLAAGAHGWDGAAWHKLPLIWGYSDRWLDDISFTMTEDAAFSKITTPVPAGYVYVLQVASLTNDTGARGMARIFVRHTAEWFALAYTLTPARYEPTVARGPIVLKEGDRVVMQQSGCLTNDVVYAYVWGYKMKVAE